MAKITWTDEASRDLDHIAEYISIDSSFYAWSVTEDILALAECIPDQPKAGRVVRDQKVTPGFFLFTLTSC